MLCPRLAHREVNEVFQPETEKDRNMFVEVIKAGVVTIGVLLLITIVISAILR